MVKLLLIKNQVVTCKFHVKKNIYVKDFSVNNLHAIFGCRTKRVFRELYNQFFFL